jgi:hypothetical protein
MPYTCYGLSRAIDNAAPGLQRIVPPRRSLSLALCVWRCGLRESFASMMVTRDARAGHGQV